MPKLSLSNQRTKVIKMTVFPLSVFILASLFSPTAQQGSGVGSVITRVQFNRMLLHRSDDRCEGRGFYTYDAFVPAANFFRGFGTTGDANARNREIAVFLAQISHQSPGGLDVIPAPDGPYSWGYCFVRERGNPFYDYREPDDRWPCAPGRRYHGRGPMQISYNYNYGPAGRAIGVNLLDNPDLVATNRTISFKTATWFWMTSRSLKPSSHGVITGRWTPSAADRAANCLPGFGVVTNIINGEVGCGHGQDSRVADRIGFYRRYCQILGVSPGGNLDCCNQKPFGKYMCMCVCIPKDVKL